MEVALTETDSQWTSTERKQLTQHITSTIKAVDETHDAHVCVVDSMECARASREYYFIYMKGKWTNVIQSNPMKNSNGACTSLSNKCSHLRIKLIHGKEGK